MPIADDGDIVRGLGFVALYAAYMEEAVDECATVLLEHDPAPPDSLGRRPTSQKVQYAQERLAQHEQLPDELSNFPGLLHYIADLFDRRNEVIHGRIYGGLQGAGDQLRPGRPEGSAKPISSVELYELANEIFETLGPLNHASWFSLPRLLR